VAAFIKEVYHPEWLANPVLVQKKSGKWRMCLDYTSLNKVCTKDPFHLPRIDQIVNSTLECKTLCFLDTYSGYHRIAVKESDQLGTSFITPFGLRHHAIRPEERRGHVPTMHAPMSQGLIGRTIEAYVDNIVVKFK
jgi:hypothetical protein